MSKFSIHHRAGRLLKKTNRVVSRSADPPESVTREDINKDLGFGRRVSEQSTTRFLNRDGSFNVLRKGLSFFGSLSIYHSLLTMSWTRFFAVITLGYFLTNLFFGACYFLCGPEAFVGIDERATHFLLASFFFSVQTLATIGYGKVSPVGLTANILVTIEALTGLLGFALATGLLFARFSRPTAKILFSNRAVIGPYRNITAFQFRIVNMLRSQLIEVRAALSFSRLESHDGRRIRKFYDLPLERSKVTFMPLHWVIVHPIDTMSPLQGISKDDLDASDPEFLIMLSGIDETFSQTVHARSSYKHDEIIWNARFSDLFDPVEGGVVNIDMHRFHNVDLIG
jgi:inward rectifier potassium channel